MRVDKERITGRIREDNGKWRVCITYYDETGKRRQKTYGTDLPVKGNKKKAERMMYSFIIEFKNSAEDVKRNADGKPEKTKKVVDANPKKTISADMLFLDWVDNWANWKKGEVREVTYNNYMDSVKNYIMPYFAKMKLKDIKPLIVDDFFCGISNKLSDASILTVKGVLSNILKRAVKFELIDKNPVEYADTYKSKVNKPQTKTVLTPDELVELFTKLKTHFIYPMIVIIAFYGLRRSECLGLTWNDIDFENSRIHIRHTMVKTKNKYTIQNQCKNESSKRTLQMTPEIKQLLLDVKAKQEQWKIDNAPIYVGNEYDLVFTYENGAMFSYHGLHQQFRYFCIKNDFARIRLHDLRHTAATILFDNGADVGTVQHLLGHSTPATTTNIYIHHTDITNSKAVNIMSNVVNFQ